MDCLTDKENTLLNSIIGRCYDGIITDHQCQSIMDQLKELVPFDYWAIVLVYYDGERVHVEELSWFQGIEGFEEHYMGNKLFFLDPVAQECVNQVKRGTFNVQFWLDTYSQHPDSGFFNRVAGFPIVDYNGYTIQHKINLLQYIGFSITGPQLGPVRDERIVKIMEAIVPHVAAIVQNGKLGRLKDLTDKQFLLYQLLKTSLSYKQIAKVLSITPSGVEKTFNAIKKKIGVNNKKELSYGFENL